MIDYWDTDTYLQVEVQTSYGSDVKTLKISYLAVDPAFTDPFSISYFTTVLIYFIIDSITTCSRSFFY